MNISFTGFCNVSIKKAEYSRFGSYQKLNNSIAQGEKKYTKIKINASLSDDEKGNDLSDYLNRVPNEFVNKRDFKNIELLVTRFDIPNEGVSQSSFKLNNKDLILNSDKKLPVMTFLARLTRLCSRDSNYSINQRKYLKLANNSIHKETVDYIENR